MKAASQTALRIAKIIVSRASPLSSPPDEIQKDPTNIHQKNNLHGSKNTRWAIKEPVNHGHPTQKANTLAAIGFPADEENEDAKGCGLNIPSFLPCSLNPKITPMQSVSAWVSSRLSLPVLQFPSVHLRGRYF